MKKKVWDHALGITFPGANQILLKMKLTLCIILFSFLGAIASESYSQTTKLSLDLKNSTVKEALGAIENQSEFFFLYSEKIIDVNRNVNIEVDRSTIEKILDKIFEGTTVNYTVKGRQIVLTTPEANLFDTSSATQQQKSVSGKITDSSGASIPGVSVVIKGTSTGTITDTNGSYSLSNVPSDATIVFSFVGMKSQEILVGNQAVISIKMDEETIGIDEVVAIGYGTVRKADLTGSVATVSAKDFDKVPSSNPLQVLQGRASGLQITTNSGLPGSSSEVLVRGVKSIKGSTSPIYVVDGMITSNIDNINPSSIESVSVLKDASAAAIYGSRASNGVILVTTKRGTGKKDLEISLNSYYGFQTESNLKLELLTGPQFLELWTEAYQNSNITSNSTANRVKSSSV